MRNVSFLALKRGLPKEALLRPCLDEHVGHSRQTLQKRLAILASQVSQHTNPWITVIGPFLHCLT